MARFSVLGISGSLRAGSHNTALLYAAQAIAPDSMSFGLYGGLGDLPPYNQDDDVPSLRAPQVSEFRDLVARADGLVIATPEYNHSVPGVLKNAIDWASTDYTHQEGVPLSDKPIMVVGASPGSTGSARAQLALRQILYSVYALVVVTPEVTVFRAHESFDSSGCLTDPLTTQLLHRAMRALEDTMTEQRTRTSRHSTSAIMS